MFIYYNFDGPYFQTLLNTVLSDCTFKENVFFNEKLILLKVIDVLCIVKYCGLNQMFIFGNTHSLKKVSNKFVNIVKKIRNELVDILFS